MSLEISGTNTQGEQWSLSKKEFIQARDDLLRLAERGTERIYLDIAADWTTVWPANMSAPMVGYPAKKATFEIHESSAYLESTTSSALTRCHKMFAELKRQFTALNGVIDTEGLTHLERKYLRR